MLLTSNYSHMCIHPAKGLNGISPAFSINRFRPSRCFCPH
jgi:hypothetical protein